MENSSESQGHLLAAARLIRRYGKNEPIQISQLVRAAAGRIGINATWEALQNENWTVDQLASIQQEWEAFNFLDPLEKTIAMERAFGAEIFPMLRDSSQPANNYFNMTPATGTSNSLNELAELGRGLVEDPAGGFKAINRGAIPRIGPGKVGGRMRKRSVTSRHTRQRLRRSGHFGSRMQLPLPCRNWTGRMNHLQISSSRWPLYFHLRIPNSIQVCIKNG